ncbi:DUF6578 domain-containing protein, partial [Streptomyces sp. SID12501]|nr:hypothetical protein [Streptomyces sp. SID12501]
MSVRVWVAAWQLQCCGEAFGTGSVVDLATQLVLGRGHDRRTEQLVVALCDRVVDAQVPMLSLHGRPLVARRDLAAETAAVFTRRKARERRRPVRLDASCTVLAL